MLSTSLYTVLKLSNTTSPNKLLHNDCVTLYLDIRATRRPIQGLEPNPEPRSKSIKSLGIYLVRFPLHKNKEQLLEQEQSFAVLNLMTS